MDCYRRKKGLYRYSPENKELKSYKAPYHIAGDDVSAICEDAHGQIFVGTLTKGLFQTIIPAGRKLRTCPLPKPDEFEYPDSHH